MRTQGSGIVVFDRGGQFGGNVTINGSVFLGSAGTNYDMTFYGDTSGRNMRWDAGADALLIFDDVYVAIGNGEDLKLWHDGSNSYIQEAGTGALFIQSADAIKIRNINGEQGVTMIPDGAVELYHNGSLKLATSSTGVSVTGVMAISGGSPADGKVWTATDSNGNGNWETPLTVGTAAMVMAVIFG